MIALSVRNFFLASVIILGGFFLRYTVLSYVCYVSFHKMTSGIMSIGNIISIPVIRIHQIFQRVRSIDMLTEQIWQENHKLKEELISLQATQDFYQDTKDSIAFQQRYKDYYKKLAQIIHIQYTPQQHFMLLDVGSNQGVDIDMVAVFKNCLLGKVIEIFPYYCKVLLITDQHCNVSVYCTRTKTEGIHEGVNQQEYSALKHISHLEKLESNDLLITSGKGLVFPRGFGVGRITSFELENVQYKVRIKPLIDPTTLKYCYIMAKGDEKNMSN